MDIKDLRKDYRLRKLDIKDLNTDPFMQFEFWFREAQNAGILEPNAMVLATASKDARPSSRSLLLKEFSSKGFVFFTHYQSRKAHELDENPFASATFLWKEIERQVIIEGPVVKTSLEESLQYFKQRPRGSQLSAWASSQDEVISSREVLEQRYQDIAHNYEGQEVPLPPHWGGYRLNPNRFEFWQGRENRLHDRFCYVRKDNDTWHLSRLSP